MSSHAPTPEIAHHRPRVREMAQAVVEKRQARAVTADIAGRVAGWHLQIAKLRGVVESRRARKADSRVVAQIDALAADIREHRTAFIKTVNTLPANVASSSWITDINRVLFRASEVVETIRVTNTELQS